MTQTIPRILHQTWKTEQIPDRWAQLARSWSKLHPSWEYYLWTDDANRAFVADHYPRLLKVYDAYSYNIQRADAVRYALLHHYGGVYVDLDVECLQPLDELIGDNECLIVLEPAEQGRWLGTSSLPSNAFIASRPGHPLMRAVLEELIANPRAGLTHRDVLDITGPLMLERVLRVYRGNDVTILPSHFAFPYAVGSPELQSLKAGESMSDQTRDALIKGGTFAVHHWANSWVDTLAGELINPDPHSIAGYDFFPGADSPGHDIANVGRDIRRAAAVCDHIPGAAGFNTDGFVKGRLLPRDQWVAMPAATSQMGLYVKRPKQRSNLLRRLGSFGR